MIVLDASLLIAHVLGESTIAVDSSIFDTLKGDRVTVPAHWSAEVASALTNNARRGRLSQADITLVLKQIDVFDIEVAKPPSVQEMSSLIAFATEQQLTAYDAAYVMLASRLGAKLATLDNAMRRVAVSISTCCRLERTVLSPRNIRPHQLACDPLVKVHNTSITRARAFTRAFPGETPCPTSRAARSRLRPPPPQPPPDLALNPLPLRHTRHVR